MTMKNKRRWRSRRRGGNLRRHPRYRLLKNWTKEEASRATPLGKGSNPGRERDPRLRRRRNQGSAKDRFGYKLRQRSALRDTYGGRTLAVWKRRGRRAQQQRTGDPRSRWQEWELRVDVVLHRSGLVNSVAQGRQRIAHGHIVRNRRGEEVVRVAKPSLVRPVGATLWVKGTVWPSHRQGLHEQWDRWPKGQGRSLPAYREVDLAWGRVTLVQVPGAGDILLPQTVATEPSLFRGP